jgi:hypothetical protein
MYTYCLLSGRVMKKESLGTGLFMFKMHSHPISNLMGCKTSPYQLSIDECAAMCSQIPNCDFIEHGVLSKKDCHLLYVKMKKTNQDN